MEKSMHFFPHFHSKQMILLHCEDRKILSGFKLETFNMPRSWMLGPYQKIRSPDWRSGHPLMLSVRETPRQVEIVKSVYNILQSVKDGINNRLVKIDAEQSPLQYRKRSHDINFTDKNYFSDIK